MRSLLADYPKTIHRFLLYSLLFVSTGAIAYLHTATQTELEQFATANYMFRHFFFIWGIAIELITILMVLLFQFYPDYKRNSYSFVEMMIRWIVVSCIILITTISVAIFTDIVSQLLLSGQTLGIGYGIVCAYFVFFLFSLLILASSERQRKDYHRS